MMAMASIASRFPEAFKGLETECVQSAVAALKAPLPTDAAEPALWILAHLLRRASVSFGQTFLDAGGLDLLLNHLKQTYCRNSALLAVLNIACNRGPLANVMEKLTAHALPKDLPTLCEKYPPLRPDAGIWQMALSAFKEAFGRPPNW